MKALLQLFVVFALSACGSLSAYAQHPQRHQQRTTQQPIDTTGIQTVTREADGTYVINTTRICFDFRGFRGPTPLEIRVKKNKIESVTALPNYETPRYFAPVKEQVLPQYVGKKVSEAQNMKVDGVTGATLSSNAVKENMRRGLEYLMSKMKM